MTDLHTSFKELRAAIKDLNRAAYHAQAAYLDAFSSPHMLRDRADGYGDILEICHATDKLVDDNAPGIKREAAG